MTKIYLAARWARQAEMRTHRELLQALGIEVTSRWLDEVEAQGNDKEQGAIKDLHDIGKSDIIVCFTETPEVGYNTGGRHVELGYAIANCLPIIVVGPRENIFYHLSTIRQVDNIDGLVALLKGHKLA